jgi:hypothetical protein
LLAMVATNVLHRIRNAVAIGLFTARFLQTFRSPIRGADG